MLSISLVLFVIIGSINLASYLNISHTINSRLELILANGGTFPAFNQHPDGLAGQPQDKPAIQPQPDHADAPYPKDAFHQRGISAESPFDTRYFTVKMDSDGTIKAVNTGKIAAISTTSASEYALSLYEKGRTNGYIDCYKYAAEEKTDAGGNSAILYVFLDCERELSAFRSFLFASLGISLAGLLVFFLLVFFFSKQMVRPMAESYEKQKRFITDASHEIKTPLTIIDANTEVLEMTEGENEWTQSTRRQIKRLAALTERLVFLSRMDEESARPKMLDFSLSEAVLDTAGPFRAVAASGRKTLDISVEPDVSFHGDEKNIRQLVSLLLDNAMKYSDADGTIRLQLHAAGRNPVLTVFNTVDAIETGNLDYLFDRFYRTDASRNSETGGFGIGLSVAQAIVTAHKGRITASSADGKSILFTVTLNR